MSIVIKLLSMIREHWKTLLPYFIIILILVHQCLNKPDASIIPQIIDPNTTNKILKNGAGSVQTKVFTPETKTPEQSGFSKEFVNDTINKILKIKDKEIKSINKIKATYVDTLKYVKEELDESNRMVKYYESRDSKGIVTGSGKVTDGNAMVYKGNVNLTSIVKKGKVDSIKFYDPTGRFTVNESKEFNYAVEPKTVKKKITFSAQVGTGIVVPNFDMKKAAIGYYGGVGISYNF